MKKMVIVLLFAIFCMIGAQPVFAVPLFDYGTFEAHPAHLDTARTVANTLITISAENDGADNDLTILEDILYGAGPIFYQGSVMIPTNSVSLTFSYSIDLPEGNDDYLVFQMIDTSGSYIKQFEAGRYPNGTSYPDSPDLSQADYNGDMKIDLTSYIGDTMTFIFSNEYGEEDTEYSSVVRFWNVEISFDDSPPVTTIPEPATMFMLGAGILGLMSVLRRRRDYTQ